jgi:ABC-2 type transport system ATP-binding protein
VITANRLTRRFGDRVVVDDVSFEVGRAEIVALLGPNGAGKTTILRMLGGLIAPTSGSVVVDGVQLTRATGATLRRRIGFLPEAPGLWDRLTVRENLAVYANLYKLQAADRTIDRLLDLFELTAHQAARAAELSKGMRQKVAIARTLLHDPQILLLDEPTSGLDPQIARAVRRLLDDRRGQGCTILDSTHNLDETERLADRVAVVQRRLIAIDTPACLRRRLTQGRIVVRVAGLASACLSAVRPFDASAAVDGQLLTLRLPDLERDTPALVRAVVEAGAEILEVRPETAALEDVYLHLLADERASEAEGR